MMSAAPSTRNAWTNSDDDHALGSLVGKLEEADGPADEAGTWPDALWSLMCDAGAQLGVAAGARR